VPDGLLQRRGRRRRAGGLQTVKEGIERHVWDPSCSWDDPRGRA
jgi:hypothetical protein